MEFKNRQQQQKRKRKFIYLVNCRYFPLHRKTVQKTANVNKSESILIHKWKNSEQFAAAFIQFTNVWCVLCCADDECVKGKNMLFLYIFIICVLIICEFRRYTMFTITTADNKNRHLGPNPKLIYTGRQCAAILRNKNKLCVHFVFVFPFFKIPISFNLSDSNFRQTIWPLQELPTNW